MNKRVTTGLMAMALVMSQILLPVQYAFAADKSVYDVPTDGKITICHRTNSVTNPYVQETISVEAADGLSGGKKDKENGANGDHYSEHKGLVFDVTANPDVAYPTPRSGDQWGDIIPPVVPGSTEEGANTAGLNWTAAGKAIYYNGCNVPVKDATAGVSVSDPTCDSNGVASVTGVVNATLDAPLVQTVGSHTATFTAVAGHLFADGSATLSVNYEVEAQSTSEDCDETQITVTPDVNVVDECETENDIVSGIETEGIDYDVDMDGLAYTVVASPSSDAYTISAPEGWTLNDNGTATFSVTLTNESCETPIVPCTVTSMTYDKPWTYDGEEFPVTGGNATYNFEPTGLYLNTPATPDEVYGMFDAGSTPLGSIDQMSYDTIRLPQSAGSYEGTHPSYFLYIDTNGPEVAGGERFYLYEPYYNDAASAEVEGAWQTWDLIDGGSAKWWHSVALDDGSRFQKVETWSEIVEQNENAVALIFGFNQGSYNAETYSAVQDLEFDCATIHFTNTQGGGSGGEEPEIPVTPVTPTTPTTPVQPVGGKGSILPAELPMTGQNGSVIWTWIALLSAILTYGAVYFMQPKKRFEN